MTDTKWPPLDKGIQVRTTAPNPEQVETWTDVGQTKRNARWGQEGTIIMHHDSHGLCYDVQFPDGGTATFDPEELEVLPQ